MRLEQLYYIVAIAETGSFTAASEKLFVAQPSISQAVSSFEKEMSITLFNRSRNGITLTENGKAVVEHARRVLAGIEEIKMISEMSDESIHMTISIGAIPSMCIMVLPQVITSFKKKFPNVIIKVTEGGSKNIVRNIKKGSLDFGIVQLSDDVNWDKDKFYFNPCVISEVKAFVRKESPLSRQNNMSFEELSKYPVVLYDEEYLLHSILNEEMSKYSPPNVVAFARNPETVRSFVKSSDVIGFGPEISWKNHSDVTGGKICMINIQSAPKVEFGIFHRENKVSNKVKDLLEREIVKAMNDLI